MMVLTLNRKNERRAELRIVYEWNPHYRGRRFWRLWSLLTPYLVVNAWV